MPSNSQTGMNGGPIKSKADKLNEELQKKKYIALFHGDNLLGDPVVPKGFLARFRNAFQDVRHIFQPNNTKAMGRVVDKLLKGQGLDKIGGAQLIGSMPNDSNARAALTAKEVKEKYEKMLHPPLTYLGDAFQYRTADGKFNSALHPHLGQAGAPYAKTVPSKTHPLGALPDPEDIFDRLMAREKYRPSQSGLSSMLVYHATIIIHDIFRTNDNDKNISDSSSYLDLSPLYGYTDKMQRRVRDDKYKLGLLKPDTFAEDRLLRQPPGVCIMLVMYNRYHNYAATQLYRINENGRFSVPAKFSGPKLIAAAEALGSKNAKFEKTLTAYRDSLKLYDENGQKPTKTNDYEGAAKALEDLIDADELRKFNKAYDAAWDKLDNDLFNTARLITCGMYVNISIHDYLRALMGFHQYNSNFTLDPRVHSTDQKNVTRGLGNQVTVEFNLLYRFHCAISEADELYTEDFMKAKFGKPDWDPKTMTLEQYVQFMSYAAKEKAKQAENGDESATDPSKQVFGLPEQANKPDLCFTRNKITGLFDDQKMINQLQKSMQEPISNFGPRNVPKVMKNIEIMGIIQARKWEIGTLNDFRDFFGMSRHETFENISKNVEIQDALRDLYEHPDKVELYPGVFCESSVEEDLDPGPSDVDSALWVAIFSDAITLVRSDRFYTVDWNTNSLTSWGMKEVSPDNDTLKSSVFHRLMQRAFPEWFPYDSIRFFHPFYTAKKNAEYAQQQGYAPEFKMEANVIQRDSFSRPTKFEYITAASEPRKPLKPLYLDDYEKIDALLSDQSDKIVHPARLELSSLPTEVAAVLKPEQKKAGPGAVKDIKVNSSKIMAYFESIMIDMIKREFITVNKAKPTYQLDVTRDFAIPVTTRYVAEFLGFSHLIRSESNLKAPYSENEIYRHITNCQIFLSYNADETKLLKRRKAFKTSIKFLYELSKGGTIHEARRWSYTRGTLHAIRRFFGYGKADTMESLGLQVAIQILGQEKDFGKAAAILLLTALDGAYNSVLAFTSVLDLFLGELYKVEGTTNKCRWQKIQKLAFQDDEKSQEITEYVLEAQKESVKLPIIRKAVEDCKIKKGTTTLISVKKGQTIICNIHKAMAPHNPSTASQTLNYSASNFGANLPSGYNPKDIAVLSLTAMIKTLAQLKDLRRGHDAQGQLKKITIDGSNEGYANFMAPGRLQQIRHDAKEKQDSRVFNEGVLKPSTESYLSPEWDEMVPFPTTWKVRFSGFGPSDYGGPKLPLLKKAPLPDDYPPFYQPQGASHTGGSFADTVCVCNVPGRMCGCKDGEGNGEVVKTEADKLGKGASGCGALG